jgi:L-Ala-D/L-Glu epimerase
MDVDMSYSSGETANASPLVQIEVAKESRPFKVPLAISDQVMRSAEIIIVSVTSGGLTGRGEGNGVYYRGETPEIMIAQIESLKADLPDGFNRHMLQILMPPGGARNALDCALWDLEAKQYGQPVWELAGLPRPKPIRTTVTLGVESPEAMASKAAALIGVKSIKIKLAGDGEDERRLQALRKVRPDVWLGVDANQGLDREKLIAMFPALMKANVALVEQPFQLGNDAALDDIRAPLFLAADESVQCLADIDALVGRYDVVNIKLDKCGGLTEAIAMVERARELRLRVMVGCMMGTSLCLAPAWLLAQICDYVDLDCVFFLDEDRQPSAVYEDGSVTIPDELWGNP